MYCSFNGSVCLVCYVSDSVCEWFGKTICNVLGVYLILFLNILEMLNVGGRALLDRPCMVFQRVCVYCACDPSVNLDAPSIVVYVGTYLLT